MALTTPLSDIVVLEFGQRIAARACGSLLAQAGATVLTPRAYAPDEPFAQLKSLVSSQPDALESAGRKAHIILTCSEEPEGTWPHPTASDQIVCDITVGDIPDRSRRGWTDPLLQAAAGLADTTGFPEGPPTVCEAPVVEMQSGIRGF
jgi:crotonobetainyl-CoA:carnitine CoA-transferase CaiB-like acyl-CoA transferase